MFYFSLVITFVKKSKTNLQYFFSISSRFGNKVPLKDNDFKICHYMGEWGNHNYGIVRAINILKLPHTFKGHRSLMPSSESPCVHGTKVLSLFRHIFSLKDLLAFWSIICLFSPFKISRFFIYFDFLSILPYILVT